MLCFLFHSVNFKKNEKEYQADKSEVLKFLREEETGGQCSTPGNNKLDYYILAQLMCLVNGGRNPLAADGYED